MRMPHLCLVPNRHIACLPSRRHPLPNLRERLHAAMAGGRLSHNEDLPVLVSAEQAPVTGAVAAERKLAHPVVHASTAGVMLEWTVVGGYSGVALPGPVVLPVCYSALTMFVRSEALHHRNSVVPGVLAAHVVEGRCAVPGGAHVVS